MYIKFFLILLSCNIVTSIPFNNDDQIKNSIISIEKSLETLVQKIDMLNLQPNFKVAQDTVQDTFKDTFKDTVKDTFKDTENMIENSQGERTRYPIGNSCEAGGSYSVNEFGANICEYPGETCPIVKYFSYGGGGSGVELCCQSNSECNYDPVKNYCHPELNRCVDGSYFGCSEKAGPIFDSCL